MKDRESSEVSLFPFRGGLMKDPENDDLGQGLCYLSSSTLGWGSITQ